MGAGVCVCSWPWGLVSVSVQLAAGMQSGPVADRGGLGSGLGLGLGLELGLGEG